MLILTVKEGGYVMINDDIRIELVQDLMGKSIKLDIDAPQSYNIARDKVYEKALLENITEKDDLKKKKEQFHKNITIQRFITT